MIFVLPPYQCFLEERKPFPVKYEDINTNVFSSNVAFCPGINNPFVFLQCQLETAGALFFLVASLLARSSIVFFLV